MNLIQVQEHLKDMPMRAIMEYANGKNPQVPPYLALGELNRRKQMEQSARTGTPPQGTVKDKLEKEITGQATDLMQAGAARQAQSNEQLQQSLMGQPQPVPEGTPQPPQQEEEMPEMPQMAAGGLTTLPTNDMFKFAGGGGVVAFANGDVVVDQAEQAAREAKESLRRYGLMQRRQDPEGYAAAQQADAAAQAAYQNAKSQYEQQMGRSDLNRAAFNLRDVGALKDQMGLGAQTTPKPSARITPTYRADDQSAAETARLARQNASIPAGIASVATPPMPPVAAPGGGIPASIRMPGAPSFTAPDKEAYSKELAAFKQANPGMAGAGFEALLNKMAQQDEADRGRVSEQEKARTRSDFFQALIAAGEATRGQKGIGALFGGFGKSAGAAEAAAFERADAQAKMRRDQEMGMAKMRAELEAARRAEARGDFEAAFKHKQDAEKIGLDLQQKEFSNKMDIAKLQEQARGNSIQAAGQNRSPALIQMAQEIQRQNKGMTFNEALDRASIAQQGAQYQSADARRQQAKEKAYQEERPHDPKMIEYMTKDPAEKRRMAQENQDAYNRIRARFGAAPAGQNAPAMPIKGTVERVG